MMLLWPPQLGKSVTLVLTLLAGLILGSPAAVAAGEGTTTTDSSTATFDAALEEARKSGATVIFVTPPAAGDAAADAAEEIDPIDVLRRSRAEFAQIVGRAGGYFRQVNATLHAASPDGTMTWLFYGIAVAVGGLAVGLFLSRYLQRWGREHFRHLYNPEPADRAEKISYLMFRAVMMMIEIVVIVIVATLVAVILDDNHAPTQSTIAIIVFGFAVFRTAQRVVFWNFLAPDAPNHRLLNLTTADAKMMHRDWTIVLAITTFVIGLSIWMEDLNLDPNAYKLGQIGAYFISAFLMSALVVKHREAFAGVIFGAGRPETRALWRRLLGRIWHIIAILYLLVAFIVSFVRLTLDLPSAYGLITLPLIILISALSVYALALLLIDKYYQNRIAKFAAAAVTALSAEQAQETPSADENLAAGEEMHVHVADEDAPAPYRPLFKELFEHGAAIIISIVALGELARAWGVDLGQSGNPVTAVLDTLLVIFIAYIAYRVVNIYVDRRIADEGGDVADSAEPGEEMSGKSASRLATLLPLFRNFLLVTILVIASMIVLSELGVDIAPLFAGAGVIGLAIGFGAQALIRDIFSGAFFLLDDAFRKGEYIDLGGIKGTVEKISMRSFQLRHHKGPLHTVPFGEIKQLTNFSRDWVMMKLPLRLTYDTDVEKVRKLVKKLGQQLLDHPEVGKNFLQPLKSQGVFMMEDSAMIVRVKFMTKPGDQFTTRKVVYASIRELFEKEGIKFAHREVTVRLADGQQVSQLSPSEREAVTAAARSVIDNEQAPGGAKPASDAM